VGGSKSLNEKREEEKLKMEGDQKTREQRDKIEKERLALIALAEAK
jgi:hypothetical protein